MNIIGKRKIFYIFSSVLLVLGIIAISVWGIKLGIDYTGGNMLEIKNAPSNDVIKEVFKEQGIDDAVIQKTQNNTLIKFKGDRGKEVVLVQKLKEKQSNIEEVSFQFVGPTVGRDLTKRGILSLILASLAIIMYIAFSFREVPKPTNSWRFGITAVLALVHDVLFVLGFWAVYSHFTGAELDSLFIPAILTIVGFSVHDTIVVFDRTRENLRKTNIETGDEFAEVANDSLNQTVVRSLSTSFTVILTLLSLYLLGGESIRSFVLILLVGITAGTYSSIFIATDLLVSWQLFKSKKNS
ncbi:MAG: protein translocase subunit SecF [Patescibacteria group bacterium]|jgi:preprotein translocase subunit SecF